MIKKIIIATLLFTALFFFSFLQYQKISALQSSNVNLESKVEELESKVNDLESRIDDTEYRVDNIE